MMKLTWQQCQAVVARCLCKFFIDGTLKAYGVIMEETVNSFETHHYFIGFAFSLQTGIGYLIGFGFGLVNVISIISLKETFETTYYTIACSVSQLPSYIGIAVMPPLLEYLQRKFGESIGMGVFGVLSWTLMLSGLFTPSGKTGNNDETDLTNLELLQTRQETYKSTEEIQKRSQDAIYEGSLNKTTGIEDCNGESKVFQHAASTTERDTEVDMNRMKVMKMEKRGKPDEKPVAWRCLKAWIFIAKHHPEFLLLTFQSMLLEYSYTSWSIFLVPYGEFLGLESSTAVWLSTLGGIAGLVGRLFSIVLFSVNRMNLSMGLLMPVLCVTSAYVISLFCNSFLALAVVSCLSGFGLSVQGCTLPSWLPSCVCEYSFKTALYGFYVVCGSIQLTGVITTGGIVDISGSYRVSFASLAILSFIQATVVLIWLICPYVPSPEKSASSRKDRITNCCSSV